MSKFIERFIEEGARKIERIRAQRDFLKTTPIRHLLDSVEFIVKKYDMEEFGDINTYSTDIYLTIKDLTGLKDERLVSLLTHFVNSNPTRESTNDYPATFSRQFRFVWDGRIDETGTSLNIVITASFQEDSETCKRVIVGYKEPSTEPTPIYEIRCEDTPPDHEPNHEPEAY